MRYIVAIALSIVLVGCAALDEKLPPAPTIAEIIQMAKTGESADAIIKRMQASRAVYQLPASELANMRDQGVPDKVIDFMQQSYIEAVRYSEWLRMRDFYLYQPFVGPPFRPYYFGRYPYGWW